MAEHSEELLPEHWLDSQRLMVGLTLALVEEAGSEASFALLEKALGYLRPPARVPDPAVTAAYLKRLETIHPATLKRLTDLSPSLLPAAWASHLPFWRMAILKLQNDGERFPLVGARLVADRIVNSSLTAVQIQKLGAAELAPDWDGYFPCKELDVVLRSTRASNRDPSDVLDALSRFRKASVPMRWEIVESALLQKLFIWPLLVLETESTSLEFSLPTLLTVATAEEPLSAIVNAGTLDAEEWEVSVHKATYAAKRLWQNKHKASPPWLQNAVEQLSASIDLGFAAKIVEPYEINLRLTGESAEAYFALAVLSALTDPTAIENICATGSIGDEKVDWEGGGDHHIREPGYVSGKFLYARDSFFFDTFLTPKPSLGVKSEKHIYVPREIKEKFHDSKKTYFSHFCDHVLEQKWRKQQYVRSPDLAEAFRPSDRKARQDKSRLSDPQVKDVLGRMRANSNPILHIDDIPVGKVAVALYAVNNAVKWDRVGSYAFLRSVPDAINERMWWPIWDLISGDPADYPKFQFASSPRTAAIALAREMNKVYPHEDDPRRAPDILVVAYTDVDLHFMAGSVVSGSPFERIKISPMIEAINSLVGKGAMIRSPIPGLHQHIGHTRIIFVRDVLPDEIAVEDKSFALDLGSEVRNAMSRLAVFRYGFKREHARRILGIQEDECDRLLSELCMSAPNHGSLLGFSEGADEYFIKMAIHSPMGNRELAELHFEAANAISGLLAPTEGVFRTNLRDAFSPRWVQEAQWHLQQAQRLIQPFDPNRLGEFRKAQQRISRLAEPFGWTNVRWFIRRIRDRRITNRKPLPEAEFLSDAIKLHFASIEDSGSDRRVFWNNTHPTEYILAARYFSELALQTGISPGRKSDFIGLRDSYLEKSWIRTIKDKSMSQTEREGCLFLHTSSKICMLLAETPDDSGVARSEYLVQQLEELKEHQSCLDNSDRDLFEYLGDRCEDPYSAMQWYRMGISNPYIDWMNPWPSLAFKFVGAAKVAGVSLSDQVKLALDSIWEHSSPTKFAIPVGGLYKIQRVQDLWKMGKLAILEKEHEFGTYGV